jgi:hypothetical protein
VSNKAKLREIEDRYEGANIVQLEIPTDLPPSYIMRWEFFIDTLL